MLGSLDSNNVVVLMVFSLIVGVALPYALGCCRFLHRRPTTARRAMTTVHSQPTTQRGIRDTDNRAVSSAGESESSVYLAHAACHQAFFTRQQGGFVYRNETNRQALAIEFFGPHPAGIEVQWVLTPNQEGAEIFLRGETFEVLRVTGSVFRVLHSGLGRGCRPTGLRDALCGSMIHEGVFGKMGGGRS